VVGEVGVFGASGFEIPESLSLMVGEPSLGSSEDRESDFLCAVPLILGCSSGLGEAAEPPTGMPSELNLVLPAGYPPQP
jgi:hypothetical protein